LGRSRSFKVTDFGTNREPICDFLLVINSNLPPIWHRFQVTAETRGIVLPDAENRTIVSSFVWTKHRNVTDGQTDRRTDRRTDRNGLASTAVCIASHTDAL